MKLDFFKMQAQGNDYIYFDLMDKPISKIDFSFLAINLSKRSFGIGSDGLVLILTSETCDAKMSMFNADGSEGLMCGSALRCVSYYLSQKFSKNEISVETLSGIKSGLIKNKDKKLVTIDLGNPKFIKKEDLTINNHSGNLISIGNPHYVVFMDSLAENIAEKQGSSIDNDKNFPGGINIEFVQIINKNDIIMDVWERGSGVTLACGTGAGAAAFCGIEKGFLSSPVTVRMPGGNVTVDLQKANIFLTGTVEHVFSGSIEL